MPYARLPVGWGWNGEREHEKERKTDNIGYTDAV